MTVLADALAAEFVDGEVLQFTGRGGRTFDYIEDETVMDRLDEVLGVGAWSITVEPISVADGIVKVRLSGTTPEDQAFVYEDFGYATRTDGEALKEAVSDGIRRCGRYLGVARYLYRKHDSPAAHGSAPSPVRQATVTGGSPPSRPVAVANPYPRAVPDDPYGETMAEFAPIGKPECPVHHKPWKSNSRGSYCATKLEDGSWCKETA